MTSDSTSADVAPSDESPTVSLRPPVTTAEVSASVEAASLASSATVTSPVAALYLDEIARTRGMSIVGMVLAVAACGSTLVLGGNPAARVALYVGMGMLFVANAGLFVVTARPERYRRWPVAIVWTTGALGCVAAGYYFGVFSPAAAGALLGIYFISLGESLPIAVGVFLVAALGWAVIGALIITGAIVDVGIVNVPHLDDDKKIAGLILTEMLYVAAFLLARSSRRVTLRSVSELERAVRGVALREALLFEAQRDLQQALQAGGPGRYTDATLGSFTLGTILGRGAMGEVYEAVESDSGSLAAVKVLSAQSLGNDQHVLRFLREARAVSALDTPHVVRVLEISPPDEPIPWIAMELLRGVDLAGLLRQERSLAPDDVAELVEQVARGVDAAAAAGIVHRDLKPQNLFCDQRDGRVWKILDFGVSKLREHEGTLTQGKVVGTPVYMAPEQALGQSVDHRADIYGLAAVGYRALTGHPPFRGKDTPSILYRVVHHAPVRPSALADVPAAVDTVFAVGLSKKPAERFTSARELATALRAALRGSVDPKLVARTTEILADNPWEQPT